MTYTAEEVRDFRERLHGLPISVADRVTLFSMIAAYAALLERREAGVTADIVKRAAQSLDDSMSRAGSSVPDDMDWGEFKDAVRIALLTVWPVAAEPAQEVPVAYLAENANEAFLFFADDHEGLDAYTADGFSITPLVRHSTPEASCGDCPTRDYKAAEPAQPTHDPDCNVHMADVKRRIAGCDCSQSHPAPSAQPANSGRVTDISRLTRYFPSMPKHPGWQMSPDPSGEWVLFADVQALAAQGQPAERDEIAEEAWHAFYRAVDNAEGQPAERVPEGQVDLQSHVMRTTVAHGGLRQLSRDLSIDVGYLSRLANGEKTEPGEEILAKLGLEKRVVYLSKQAEFMRACEQESQSNG